MNSYKKAMGKKIKECRRKLGLTRETAAEELGISVKHFSEVERGIAGLSALSSAAKQVNVSERIRSARRIAAIFLF